MLGLWVLASIVSWHKIAVETMCRQLAIDLEDGRGRAQPRGTHPHKKKKRRK